MGIVYILLSIVCSVLIAHFLRTVKQHPSTTVLSVLTINYAVATLVASFSLSTFTFPDVEVVLLGVFTGLGFMGNFLIYAENLKRNGLSLSVGFMRASLLIPVVLGWLVLDDPFTFWIIIGLVTVAIGFYLTIPKVSTTKNIVRISSLALLLALFFVSGATDFSLAFFEFSYQKKVSEWMFLFLIFGSAFIALLGVSVFRNPKDYAHPITWGFGLIIGIPNVLSSFFTIKSLQFLPTTVVYPAINAGIILLSSVLGLWYWKDRLTPLQYQGLGFIIISIIVFSIV